MKKGYIILIVCLIAAIIGGTILFLPTLTKDTGNSENSGNSNSSAGNENSGSEITPPEEEPMNNQPQALPETPIVVPNEMQTVIDENTSNLYQDDTQKLASAYPSQMIPLYGTSGVSESYGMTNDQGKPGWITSYVSNNTTEELLAFYSELLRNEEEYTETPSGEATNLKTKVSGYSVSLTVTPNNPQRTDLQGASSVNIFIEEL